MFCHLRVRTNWWITTLKAQGLSVKSTRLKTVKSARVKGVRSELEGVKLRECPETSYVSFFFIQKLFRLPVWESF